MEIPMNPDIASLWVIRHKGFPPNEIYMVTSKTAGVSYFLTCIQTGEEILLWQFQVDEMLYPYTGPEETHT